MKDSDFAIGFKQGQEHGKQIMLEKIEDIKAEIGKQDFTHHDGQNHWYMTPQEVKEIVFKIIDKHISGKEKE